MTINVPTIVLEVYKIINITSITYMLLSRLDYNLRMYHCIQSILEKQTAPVSMLNDAKCIPVPVMEIKL